MENKRNGLHVRPPVRGYSEAFKRKIVREIERGQLTKDGARRRYGIGGKTTVLRWCRQYGQLDQLGLKVIVQTQQERDTTTALRDRVRKLEEALADEKLKVMALETMIEVAERELKAPIRKKSGAKQ